MIRGLDDFLRSSGLVHTLPLSTLRDTRIGIDLGLYLESLLAAPDSAEPYVAALGGSPLAIISHIENDLRALDKAKIKPVFVLGGILPSTRSTGSSNSPKSRALELQNDTGAEERQKAWDSYEQGDVDGLYAHLERSSSVHPTDLIRSVLRAFRHRNIEFMVAPFLAEAQVSLRNTAEERDEPRSLCSKSHTMPVIACLFGAAFKVVHTLNLWLYRNFPFRSCRQGHIVS